MTSPVDWPMAKDWACPICGTTWTDCKQRGELFSFLWTVVNGTFQCQGCKAFYALRDYDSKKTEDQWVVIKADDGSIMRSLRMPPDYVPVPIEATLEPWLTLLKYVWPKHYINLDIITTHLESEGRPPKWLTEALEATGITRKQLKETL